MPSSAHHPFLAFEIVTPPIVAPSLTRAVPTCTPPAACRRRPLGTPAAPACRSGLDDVTPDRVPPACNLPGHVRYAPAPVVAGPITSGTPRKRVNFLSAFISPSHSSAMLRAHSPGGATWPRDSSRLTDDHRS